MLNPKDFLKGIIYLKKYYLNFNFDINDKQLLNIWYGKFKDYSDSQFQKVVQRYCEVENYPPNSPQVLLKFGVTRDSKEVWEWLCELNNMYPFDNDFTRPKFYQELLKDKRAYNVFERVKIDNFFDRATKLQLIRVSENYDMLATLKWYFEYLYDLENENECDDMIEYSKKMQIEYKE